MQAHSPGPLLAPIPLTAPYAPTSSMNLISGHMGTSLIPNLLAQCAMRMCHILPGTHILPCQLYTAFRKVLRASLSRVALNLVMWSLALLT